MLQHMLQGCLWSLRKSEKGALAIEYAVIVSFIALVFIVGATTLGTQLDGWFSSMATKVGNWASS